VPRCSSSTSSSISPRSNASSARPTSRPKTRSPTRRSPKASPSTNAKTNSQNSNASSKPTARTCSRSTPSTNSTRPTPATNSRPASSSPSLRRWIADYGFGLLTATHCRKLPAGRTTIALDDLFGSSLFTRDPELILGIQRHTDLTKLHVFKSREPGLEHGQTFDLLFDRERGYRLVPKRDPEQAEADREEAIQKVIAHVQEHPGDSTNKIARAVRMGTDRTKAALEAAAKSELLSEPVQGSRNAIQWFPLNHAGLTSPETLLGKLSEDAPAATTEPTSPAPHFSPVGGGGPGSEVGEADPDEVERLANLARETLE
jgi:hypothetical protein